MRERTAEVTTLQRVQEVIEAIMYQSRFSLEHQWDTQGCRADKAVNTLAVYPLRL
jgi:hypothetical protein